MQELVDDSGDIRVSPEIQHMVGYDDEAYDEDQTNSTKLVFAVHFGQVYLSKPTTVEKDGTVTNMFPHEARLRNLTYSAPLYVDVDLNQYQVPRDLNVNDPSEDLGEPVATEHAKKEFLGYVPIMLRSLFCVLSDKDDADLADLGECIYDQGESSLNRKKMYRIPIKIATSKQESPGWRLYTELFGMMRRDTPNLVPIFSLTRTHTLCCSYFSTHHMHT